jgi:hypothetical protein
MDVGSFLPAAETPPVRQLPRRPSCCSDYALSLFLDREKAEAKHRQLRQSNPNLTRIGSHLARVEVTEDHGVQTTPNHESHFDLFEFAGVDLSAAARYLGPLC